MKLKLEKLEELIGKLTTYTNSTIEIVKLETAQRTSSIIAKLISVLIIGVVISLFVFFLSLGVGMYLSDVFDNTYLGYGIVTGFYLLVAIILIVGRKKLLINHMRDKIIQEIC
ncbi:MAG: phage holin family protein [Bacteroidales bacterium]